jgi:hypothetical protein
MPRSTSNAASLLVRLPCFLPRRRQRHRQHELALEGHELGTSSNMEDELPTNTNSKRTTFIDPLDVHDGDLQLRRVRRLQLAAERATNLGDADRADAVVRKAKNVV